MAANDYLDFNTDDITERPEEFEHDIDGVTYTLVIYYNDANDSFYIDIYDNNVPPVPIVMGEKLIYGMPLWNSVNDPRLPAIQIVPIDDDGNESTVDGFNFPDIVRLEFLDTEPDDTVPTDDPNTPTINDPNYADSPDDAVNLYGNDPVRGDD